MALPLLNWRGSCRFWLHAKLPSDCGHSHKKFLTITVLASTFTTEWSVLPDGFTFWITFRTYSKPEGPSRSSFLFKSLCACWKQFPCMHSIFICVYKVFICQWKWLSRERRKMCPTFSFLGNVDYKHQSVTDWFFLPKLSWLCTILKAQILFTHHDVSTSHQVLNVK